ncbi:MAG: 2Fe-2S iron-sulfur cluster-binding protein [Polyangiaceae bacterium]
MTLRTRPCGKPVEFLHDGELLTAEAGEPLAFALVAAERLLLSRSPKLHRPRGPYCLRGACDGCLVRVDGVPNVMACQHPLRGGETVETQNVMGTREVDLLAATDFMFPHGIDHHRLFAGVRGVSALLQRAARRIAGLGRLPDQSAPVEPSKQLDVEVLIVGGGASALAIAAELGPSSLLVEESPHFGGARRLCAPEAAADLLKRARQSGAKLLSETTAVGVFTQQPFGVLLAGAHGLCFVRAQKLVLAQGGHSAQPGFANGDLPGIFSARAGLELLRSGVAPGARTAVIGRGEFADVAARELGARLALRVEDESELEAARGSQGVSGVTLRSGEKSPKLDALLYDAAETPAFELAVQAGARTHFDAKLGYLLERDDDGQVAPGAFALGRLAVAADGQRPAPKRVRSALSAR